MTLAVLGLFALVNPFAAAVAVRAGRRVAAGPLLAGALAAAAILVALAAAGTTLLDALDVSPGTFRLGAGAVATAAGLRWLLDGAAAPVDPPARAAALAAFAAFPVLLTPGAVVLATSLGATGHVAEAAAGAVVAVAAGAGALAARLPESVAAPGVRLLGAVAVVIGVVEVVGGLKTL